MSSRRDKNKPRNSVSRQLEEPREKERDDNLITLGKFFYSLSGLTYAGVILTKVTDFRYGDAEILYWSIIATVILAVIAWFLVKVGNIKR